MEFSFNPTSLDNVLTIDPTVLITESVWDESLITEDTEGVTKKNLFQRLWSLLKKFWAMIAAKAKEMVNWFTAIFRTKKVNDKTLDEIAESVFSDLAEAPGSKHLRFRYDNDQQIRMNIVGNMIKNQVKQPKIVGHDKHDRPYQQAFMLVFHIIKQPHLIDPLIDFLTAIKGNPKPEGWSAKRVEDACNAIWAGTAFGTVVTVSMEEWTILNERIQKFQQALQVVDNDTFSTEKQYDESYAKVMNQLVSIGSYLQKGINGVADGMRQVYELDEKYHDKINAKNFREKLPLFVKRCVEGNIPSKYINHAVRQICDVSINADPKNPSQKADVNKPMKGNGRFVIIPGDESLKTKVIKVAYNGLGVRGNRNEFVVWDKVKNIPEIANELYQIEDINDPDNYVILCDRAEEIDQWDGAVEWNNKMREMCQRNNVGFIIRCNAGGFGKRLGDGKVICIDYGNVHRIPQTDSPEAPATESVNMVEEVLNSSYGILDMIDPMSYFKEDGQRFCEDTLREATEGATKKNVFQKLWEAIKKFWKWICKKFSQMTNFLRAKLGRNKKTKTADQIAEEVLQNTDNPNPPSPANADATQPIKIEIPADPKSEIKMDETIDLAFKELWAKIEKDGKKVTFGYAKTNESKKGGAAKEAGHNPAIALRLINDPTLLPAIMKCVDLIAADTINVIALGDAWSKCEQIINTPTHTINMTADLDQLVAANNTMNEIAAKIDTVNDIDENNPKFQDRTVIAIVNKIVMYCARMQFSVNALTNNVGAMYRIDARYNGMITNLADMEKFVMKCIEAGMPYKYIGQNMYVIASKNIKGTSGKGSEKKPIWGQTRVVMFPDDTNIIYKVAMNTLGVKTNIAEENILERFKGSSFEQYFPMMRSATPKSCIIAWERLDTDRGASQNQILQLRNKIATGIDVKKLPIDITRDFHDGNVAWRGNTLVFCDFGGFAARHNYKDGMIML